MNKDNYCLFTNDVETTSILNHRLSDKTGKYLLKEGMPRLLELYSKYKIKTTFFFTGYIAKLYPELVKMVIPHGHEVGSHGLTHVVNQAFDILPLKTQIEHLAISKKILEDISGDEVHSFRAPASRVNKNISIALEETGFKIDSSISAQRFDMFFSFGSKQKLNWINAHRIPYFTAHDNIWKKGNGPILEIPISAWILPYIGTAMRITPSLNKITRYLLYIENIFNNKPIVFLTHPNEFIDEELEVKTTSRRSSNVISYILGDLIRHKLKVKNLGKAALPIYEKEIEYFYSKKYDFITCKAYYFKIINNKSVKE